MRTLFFALGVVLLGCDRDEPAPATEEPAQVQPRLSVEQVCEAFVALPVPDDVVIIAAAATEGAIAPTADGAGTKAEVLELRAESGPVENGQRRIDGVTLTRKLTLKHDGTRWSVVADAASSRSEIFYVRKTPDHDPRTLFGEQVIERYGPKGGHACALPRARVGPKVTSAEICAAIIDAPLPEGATRLAASASPGFTRPEQGETVDPPTLGEGQAGATVTELLVRSDPSSGSTRKHRLVTATRNVVLARGESGWSVASSQPVFEGEFLTAERPSDTAPRDVFADEELLDRYRPKRGSACSLPASP